MRQKSFRNPNLQFVKFIIGIFSVIIIVTCVGYTFLSAESFLKLVRSQEYKSSDVIFLLVYSLISVYLIVLSYEFFKFLIAFWRRGVSFFDSWISAFISAFHVTLGLYKRIVIISVALVFITFFISCE